ncbi:MAG: HD domain-containing protein [Thermoprotei archaeon]
MLYYRVDPLNFSVWATVDDSVRDKIKDRVVGIFQKHAKRGIPDAVLLNAVADDLVNEVYNEIQTYHERRILRILGDFKTDGCEFVYTPADTRFPGNTNSLGEHIITTSAFAVVAALSYLNKYGVVKVEDNEYDGVKEKLSDREFVRGFVRVAALLHDIGKPPPKEHVQRSCDVVTGLSTILDKDLVKALCEVIRRHHYGVKYNDKPRNVLEWIVALADKASAGSRGFIPKEQPRKLKDAVDHFLGINIGYDLGWDRLRLLKRVLEDSNSEEEEEEDDPERSLYGFLSKDPKRVYQVNKQLLEAEAKIVGAGDDRLACLFLLDVPSIQSYISRGRTLAVSVGYSIMVDAFIHKVAEIIEKDIGREVVLSKEGGSLLALIPVGYHDELLKKIEGIKEKSYFRCSYHVQPIKLSEAFLGPEQYWEFWNKHSEIDPLKRDSMRTFGTLVSKFLFDASTRRNMVGVDVPAGGEEDVVGDPCAECKMNVRVDDKYCAACKRADEWYKAYRNYIINGIEPKDDFAVLKELRSAKIVSELKKKNIKVKIPQTLDEWSNKYIAFVSADGDNFGALKSQASTLTHYISTVMTLTDGVYLTLLYSLVRIVNNNPREAELHFLPAYIGGDDLLLVIPGEYLKDFLVSMEKNLKNLVYYEANDKSSDDLRLRRGFPYMRLGVSAGVFMTKNVKFPFFLAIENARNLEKASKKYAKSTYVVSDDGRGFVPHFTFTLADDKTYGLATRGRGDGRGWLTLNGEILDELTSQMDKWFYSNNGVSPKKARSYFQIIRGEDYTLKILYHWARNGYDVKTLLELFDAGRKNRVDPIVLYYLLYSPREAV